MLNIIRNIAEDGSCEIFDLYTRYEDSAWHIAAASERDRFCVSRFNVHSRYRACEKEQKRG